MAILRVPVAGGGAGSVAFGVLEVAQVHVAALELALLAAVAVVHLWPLSWMKSAARLPDG